MKNKKLTRTIGISSGIISMIVAGIISIFSASDIARAYKPELVAKKQTGKSEMGLAQKKLAPQPNIPTIDRSQPAKFETATFGVG
jgi:hypothetical protein